MLRSQQKTFRLAHTLSWR